MGSFAGLPFVSTAALVAALAPAPVPSAQPAGAIFVSTLPAGADVWIDGTYVGRSPALIAALPPGKHAVTLTKTGWVVQELDVEVKPASTALSVVELSARPARAGETRATGTYVLRGVPKGAKVLVDGVPAAADGLTPVALGAGVHRASVLTERGRTTLPFEIVPDTNTEVVLHEPAGEESRSAVVAPASEYLPADACVVEGKKIVVRYSGHVVVAHFGENVVRFDGQPVSYAGAPHLIGAKLYLPLELLERLRPEAKAEPEPSRTR
jgi:hypothetical protein